jgi:hypothetical protein
VVRPAIRVATIPLLPVQLPASFAQGFAPGPFADSPVPDGLARIAVGIVVVHPGGLGVPGEGSWQYAFSTSLAGALDHVARLPDWIPRPLPAMGRADPNFVTD